MTSSEFISQEDKLCLERRRFPRYPCAMAGPVRLFIARRDESWWAWARDVSATGISLVVTGPLEPGTKALIQVKQDPLLSTLRGEVIHATEQPDGTWVVGCQLEGVDDDELSAAQRLRIRDLFRSTDD